MSVTQKSRPALPPVRFRPAADSAFRSELRQAAEQYLTSHSEHRFGNAGHYLKGILLALLAAAAYWLAVSAGQLWRFAPAYFAFLFLAMLLAMNVLHDAAHYAYVRQPWLNRLLMRLVSIPVVSIRHSGPSGMCIFTIPTPTSKATISIPNRIRYCGKHRISAGCRISVCSICTGRWWRQFPCLTCAGIQTGLIVAARPRLRPPANATAGRAGHCF